MRIMDFARLDALPMHKWDSILAMFGKAFADAFAA